MQRAGRLFSQILAHDNLRWAFHKASRGRRCKEEARLFAAHLSRNLAAMTQGLLTGTIPLGNYHQFTIHDPKERLITAPSFPERVLHHAVMNVCEPVLEQWLITDTYACRAGRGRIAAVDRARHFAAGYPFFLKLDIRKYFPSISHRILLGKLTCVFKDLPLLQLLDRIIASYEDSPARGLPIGSLTSQHFANFYLGWFDRFVKEHLRVRGYVRYMDDSMLWGTSAKSLRRHLQTIAHFLGDELELDLKSEPYINRTCHGVDFLGCRVFADHVTLNRRSRVRFRRRLQALEEAFAHGRIDEDTLQRRATALVAFTRAPGVSSWQFRRSVLERMPVSGHGLEPGVSRRQLEQRGRELPVGEPQQELAVEPEQQPGFPAGRSSAWAVDAAWD